MPVSANLILPANIRVDHLRVAILRLIGYDVPAEQAYLVARQYVRYEHVSDEVRYFMIEYGPTGITNSPWRKIQGILTFHFKNDSPQYDDRLGTEGCLITVNNLARNLALFDRLAKFFGGRVTVDNLRGILFEYEPKSAQENCPVDDENYNALYKRLSEIKSITLPQLVKYKKWANYQ